MWESLLSAVRNKFLFPETNQDASSKLIGYHKDILWTFGLNLDLTNLNTAALEHIAKWVSSQCFFKWSDNQDLQLFQEGPWRPHTIPVTWSEAPKRDGEKREKSWSQWVVTPGRGTEREVPKQTCTTAPSVLNYWAWLESELRQHFGFRLMEAFKWALNVSVF